MDVKEYAKQYNIQEDILKEYIDGGLLEDILSKRNAEAMQKRINDCRCLSSFGLTISVIKHYLQLSTSQKDTTQERIQILTTARKSILHAMHSSKEIVECIDTLLGEIQAKK